MSFLHCRGKGFSAEFVSICEFSYISYVPGLPFDSNMTPHRLTLRPTSTHRQLALFAASTAVWLGLGCCVGASAEDTVRLSPRTRAESLSGLPLPALSPSAIEPFLNEPIVVDEQTLAAAPRIVAGNEGRVLLARGDRAYARGPNGAPLTEPTQASRSFRVFRDATPLQDPDTGRILGYEAQYLGRAQLQRGESAARATPDRKESVTAMPATIDIVAAREEIRAGDKLLPEPSRQLTRYLPHAPARPIQGRIVSVYGNAAQFAGQNQIVAINRGTRDGIENGHVLAILKNGETLVDPTAAGRETIKLPNERVGLLMVFRPFEKVSYALVLETSDTPRAGDHLVNP